MLNVAVTGATGLIGSRLIELLKNDFHLIPLPSALFDITQKEFVSNYIAQLNFDIMLHLAAYTNVEGAEQKQEKANALNVVGVKNVYEATQTKGKKFIYVSTDYVFDGKKPPFFEDSKPNPLGKYAQTKYEGEKIVQDHAMIIRTSYPYGISNSVKLDFVRKLIMALKQNKILSMTSNASITPTYIDDFVYATGYLLKHYSPEIFHIVGADSLSPYNAALHIAKIFNQDKSLIIPVTFAEYSKGKAPRSQFSVIKSKKNNFYRMKTFEQGLIDLYNKSL